MASEEFTYKGRRVTVSRDQIGHWSATIDKTTIKLGFSFEVGFDDDKQRAAITQLAKLAIDTAGVLP